MELELAKCKMDMMSLNSQLLDAIQQKLNLSQQLEAWQVREGKARPREVCTQAACKESLALEAPMCVVSSGPVSPVEFRVLLPHPGRTPEDAPPAAGPRLCCVGRGHLQARHRGPSRRCLNGLERNSC